MEKKAKKDDIIKHAKDLARLSKIEKPRIKSFGSSDKPGVMMSTNLLPSPSSPYSAILEEKTLNAIAELCDGGRVPPIA